MKKGRILAAVYILVIGIFIWVVKWGSETVTTAVEGLPIIRKYCIVIDAGHGGVDGGATSCTGKLESSFNLEIALRLNDLFHLLGYETRMIRTTDSSVYTSGETIAQKKVSDLKERVRLINETENAVVLSIHQNNFSESKYSGAQVFYGTAGESEALAKTLQTAFVSSVNPGSNRQCKKSQGIFLMEQINCTGVLIECGFLSNIPEEAKLRTPEYQKQLCCVIAATTGTFLSNS